MILQVPSIETRLVDITEWDAVRTIVEGLGPIDLLVNNAGITNWTPFLDVTKQELDEYVTYGISLFINRLAYTLS